MLDDYSLYIDPEEDEVFFTAYLDKPIVTVSRPNNSFADLSDEELENVFINKEETPDCPDSVINQVAFSESQICARNEIIEGDNDYTMIHDAKSEDSNGEVCPKATLQDIENSSEESFQLCDTPKILDVEECNENNNDIAKNVPNKDNIAKSENFIGEEDFPADDKSKEDVKEAVHEVEKDFICLRTPRDKKLSIKQNLNVSIEDKENIISAIKIQIAEDLSNEEENTEKDIFATPFKTPLKRSPLKAHNKKSACSPSASGRKSKARFSQMRDISSKEDQEDWELSADVNESLVSWSSVDVNVQLENLMADLDFAPDDSVLGEDLLHLSSTPQKCGDTPEQLNFKWTSSGLDVNIGSQEKGKPQPSTSAPDIVITAATPAVVPPLSPTSPPFYKPVAPVRLVYSSSKKAPRPGASSSSSSSDSQPFVTPRSTPSTSAKGFQSSIPKLSAKKVAAKSLHFRNIESPISKYIYDKSTPLVCNVKSSRLASHVPSQVTGETPKPASAVKPLPPARYQKGVPMRQEKPVESKLPRLGRNQMRVVSSVPGARVISHSPRQADVSVLVSSPAKIKPGH